MILTQTMCSQACLGPYPSTETSGVIMRNDAMLRSECMIPNAQVALFFCFHAHSEAEFEVKS